MNPINHCSMLNDNVKASWDVKIEKSINHREKNWEILMSFEKSRSKGERNSYPERKFGCGCVCWMWEQKYRLISNRHLIEDQNWKNLPKWKRRHHWNHLVVGNVKRATRWEKQWEDIFCLREETELKNNESINSV